MALSNSLECIICCKVFANKGNLNKHNRKHTEKSQITPALKGLFKCFEGCELAFKTNRDLRKHLSGEHNFEVVENRLEFDTFEEFEVWLLQEEKNNNIRFYKPRGMKRNVNGETEKFVYLCSRSGKQRSILADELRKRNERCQGSSKLSFGCTSQINVTKSISTNKCSIIHFSTHYGHTEEIQHIRISKSCRKEVAQKLMMGVSTKRVLDSTRDNIKEELNRDDLLTRMDVFNIKNAYHITTNEGCRHHDDATSVYLWAQECMTNESNPILFFKKQGEIIPKWRLGVNDFCLVLMTSIQIEIFKQFGNNIVCVDGTHGMNAYNFELTTVLVLDEFSSR